MVKYWFHIGQPRDFRISSFISSKVVASLKSCFGSWETSPSELNQSENNFGSVEILPFLGGGLGVGWEGELLMHRNSFFSF